MLAPLGTGRFSLYTSGRVQVAKAIGQTVVIANPGFEPGGPQAAWGLCPSMTTNWWRLFVSFRCWARGRCSANRLLTEKGNSPYESQKRETERSAIELPAGYASKSAG